MSGNLGPACSSCGRPIELGARFCKGCGSPLAGDPAPTRMGGAMATAPPPSTTPNPASSATLITGVHDGHPMLTMSLAPGESIELAFNVKRGGVIVTPQRVVAIVFPEEGSKSSTNFRSYVDRRAVKHIIVGVQTNLVALVLGALFVVGGLVSAATAGSSTPGAIVGLVLGLAIGCALIYFARKGAIAMRDTTGIQIRIPLRRTEIASAGQFAEAFGATLGR